MRVSSGQQLHVLPCDVAPLGVLGKGLQVLGSPLVLVNGELGQGGDDFCRQPDTSLSPNLTTQVTYSQLYSSSQSLELNL